MIAYQQLTLPGFGSVPALEADSGKSGKTRWYYVCDWLNDRMLVNDPDCSRGRFVALNLADAQILLFNSLREARDMAREWRAVVKIYPYPLDLMRSRWQWHGPSR